MNIEVVEKEGLKRELTIEVPAEKVDEKYEEIYAEYRKKAKIDGFRSGKVPRSVIRNKFKGEATAALVDELVQKYFNEAVKEKKLEPVGAPTLYDFDVDEGKPLKFKIGIEVMPVIDSVKYENITVEDRQLEVADSDVDKILENFQKGQAEVRIVERPAGKEDILIVDLEPSSKDDIFDEGVYSNQEIDLSNEFTDKEFLDALIGSKANDSKEVKIDYAADYPNERFAGKSATYKVTVKEVKERILPELSDAFAKQTGHGETLLELKLNIRKQIENDQQAEITRSRKKAVIDQIVEQNQIDVPETMLESYMKGVFEDHKKNEKEINEDELREKYRPIGIASIRWYLLFHRLGVQEKIEVSTEDTENWIKRFADNYRMDIPKAKEILAKTGKAAEIRDGILEEKVLEFLSPTVEASKG